jgi:OOP family OmpA-OmpF porin
MKPIAALVMLFAFYTASFGQTKKEWLKYADIAFKNGDYKNAVVYYTKVLDKGTPSDITHPYEARPFSGVKKQDTTAGFKLFKINLTGSKTDSTIAKSDTTKVLEVASTTDQYVVHQIAESYRLNHDYQNAELWYKQSVKNNLSIYPFETYWLGDAFMKNKNYAAANLQFEAALAKATETKNEPMINLAKQKIAGCYMGVDANAVQKGVIVTELDSLYNTGTSSFALNYYGDESTLQFSAARVGNVVADPKKQNAKFSTDIYKLSKTETGSILSKVEGPINTNQNEGAGFMASDNSRFFFTRWSQTNRNECAIYFSRLFNGEWLIAQKMNDKVNLDGYRSTDPIISADGSILYYSSNRPGGFGKMDLWFEYIDEDGRTYGDPINMGPLFNTSEDEVSPFFHEGTTTLYFSSDGHAGFGGLDVFKASLNKDDSVWTAPRNLGMPINSSKDDTYFVLDANQQNGFVSSDRKDCESCTGSACNKLYSVTKEKNVYDVKGVVYNAETNAPEANATITFKDIRSDWDPFVITTDSTGSFFYELKEGIELYMKAQKPNFLGDAGTVITLGLTESKHFERDFFISPIASGNISFPNIEFDFETMILRQTAMKALSNMAEVLKLNNDFKISIESHTDISERGLDKNNIQLSEQRSKACFDYLVSLGIAPERMVTKGFGDTRLITANPKTEEDHQRNRRTTFSLIK